MFSKILDKLTARTVAIALGLTATVLIVVLVVVAVDDSNTNMKLKECEEKLEVLQSFIESLSKATTSMTPTVTTASTSISS
ncbi:uncharacterized protein LOC120766925 [Bactrocera tryoni]|uniref:uncharacterized protein LOC120766925 n=1 Tax=Bactrocera tryoni TaxID=59916 RepID=UPI001A968DA8|nr:uncharacterized protein LOC120766925 [Bactrocera tryoni]